MDQWFSFSFLLSYELSSIGCRSTEHSDSNTQGLCRFQESTRLPEANKHWFVQTCCVLLELFTTEEVLRNVGLITYCVISFNRTPLIKGTCEENGQSVMLLRSAILCVLFQAVLCLWHLTYSVTIAVVQVFTCAFQNLFLLLPPED